MQIPAVPQTVAQTPPRGELARQFRAVRERTQQLAQPLSAEDQCVQSMPDASPTKWHLGHTSWFFEAVVLQALQPDYAPFDPRYLVLFNSYYEALGPRHPRPQRGLLTRPSLQQVQAYRDNVDAAILSFMAQADAALWREAQALIELGLNHEQQHQELMLTDILHLFASNPLLPHYTSAAPPGPAPTVPPQWLASGGGIYPLGHGASSFCFDNETPQHQVLVHPFLIANRLVNCAEYLAFMEDGGYRKSEHWLSDGWQSVQTQGWSSPAYWIAPGDPRAPCDQWQCFGLNGVQKLDPLAPVSHVSFYEAAAFADWSQARLPTEFEWEVAQQLPAMTQAMGQVWQWTRSAYEPYPGFRARSGAVREYNGKFMVGQQVLRGSSSATPMGHSRGSYRNFFPPAARWQFTGIRLARDS